jgi:hypothetical protein
MKVQKFPLKEVLFDKQITNDRRRLTQFNIETNKVYKFLYTGINIFLGNFF